MTPFNECWLQPYRHSSLYVYVYYVYYVFFPSCPVHCFSCLNLSILSLFFVFHLLYTFSFSSASHSPDTRLSFSSAVSMVFSSIYSGATGLLKAERLPGELLFAWDLFPTFQVSHVISFTLTPIVPQPWADAFTRHFYLILSYSLFKNIYKLFPIILCVVAIQINACLNLLPLY